MQTYQCAQNILYMSNMDVESSLRRLLASTMTKSLLPSSLDTDCLPDMVALGAGAFWHNCYILLYYFQQNLTHKLATLILSRVVKISITTKSGFIETFVFITCFLVHLTISSLDCPFFSSRWSLRYNSCTIAQWCRFYCRTQHKKWIPPGDCSSYPIPRHDKDGRHSWTSRV